MNNKHIDCWMNDEVFIKQLDLSVSQLSSINMPQHWIDFIKCTEDIMQENKIYKLLDIGCGSGIYYKLCSKYLPNIQYFGTDFSNNAINTAKDYWGVDCFSVKNVFELDIDYVTEFDLIHLGAVLDVLPNGDEALESILKLKSKNVILGRIDFTNNISHNYEYSAYDSIFIRYKHNVNNFFNIIKNHNYEAKQFNSTFHLKYLN